MKKLSWYQTLAREILRKDRTRVAPNRYSKVDLFAKIDEAYACFYNLPTPLTSLEWIGERKFVSTMVADSIDAGIRTFATLTPNISVLPTRENEDARARAETIEKTLEWYFSRMNMSGRKSPHWKVVSSAMKYCAGAVQVEYLPHRYRGRENEPMIKYLLSQKKFDWRVHHAGTVSAEFNNDIPTDVVKCTVVTGKFLRDEFGEKNTGVIEMISRLKSRNIEKELLTTLYTYYDFENWTDRVQWAVPNGQNTAANWDGTGERAESAIEFRREQHGLPFINWVIVDHEDPLTKNVFNAGLWENANDLRAMQYSKAVELVASPSIWVVTQDGTLRNVKLDYKSVIQPLVTDPQAKVIPLPPVQIDPQLASMVAKADSEIAQSTVAQVLSSAEAANQVQNYSLYNAMLQAAIGQLSLAKTCAERIDEAALHQELMWGQFTGDTLLAYDRGANRRDKNRGRVLRISSEDMGPEVEQFNLTDLYLTVELQAQSLTDEQARMNNEIMWVERMQGSRRSAYDRMGRSDYDTDRRLRAEEDLWDANKAASAKRILGKQEIEQARALAESKQPAQPALPGMGNTQNPANTVNDLNAGSAFAGAEGMDNRGGGFAAQGVAPGEGREQITGTTAGGQELA